MSAAVSSKPVIAVNSYQVCAVSDAANTAKCVAETERYRQLTNKALQKRHDKSVRLKQAKLPAKPLPDQAALERARAAVQKRQHALNLAQREEQKAQNELRRKKLLEKQRLAALDKDEGMLLLGLPLTFTCYPF